MGFLHMLRKRAKGTSALICVCIMNITRLLESKLFWLRDEGQKVGQRSLPPKGTYTRDVCEINLLSVSSDNLQLVFISHNQ